MDSFADTFKPVDINEEVDRFGRSVDVIGDSVDALDETQTPKAEVKIEEKEVVEPTSSFSSRFRPVTAPEKTSETTSSFSSRFKPVNSSEDTSEPTSSFSSRFRPVTATGPSPEEEFEKSMLPEGVEPGSYSENDMSKNPELFDIVFEYMSNRYGLQAVENKSNKDIVNKFLNNRRGVAMAGNSLRVAAETAYLFDAKENPEELKKVAKAYTLYKNMAEITDKDTTWPETGEAVGDVMREILLDPFNFLTLGVGKIVGGTATKVGVKTLENYVMKEVQKQLLKGVSKETIKKSSTAIFRKAAIVASKEGGEEIAKYSARMLANKGVKRIFTSAGMKEVGTATVLDSIAGSGFEYLYQRQLVDSEAQEDVDRYAVGLAALSSLVIGGVSAGLVAKRGFSDQALVSEVVKGGNPSAVAKELKKSIEKHFSEMGQNLTGETSWVSKVSRGNELDVQDTEFFTKLLLGESDKDGNVKLKGLAQTMQEQGFYFTKKDDNDKLSNFISDFITDMEPDDVKSIITGFEKAAGVKLKGLGDKSPTSFANAFAKKMNNSAQSMNSASQVAKRLNIDIADLDVNTYLEDALGLRLTGLTKGDELATKLTNKGLSKIAAGQNNFIRLLVAHPSTSMLNVMGYGASSGLGSVNDIIRGTVHLGVGQTQQLIGMSAKGVGRKRLGAALLKANANRIKLFLDPEMTAAAYKSALLRNSGPLNELSKVQAGGIDVSTSLDKMLDTSKIGGYIDKYVDVAQTATFVKSQDIFTKSQEYIFQMDKALRVTFDKSYKEFYNWEEASKVMATKKYKELELSAVTKVMEHTFSKSYKGTGVLGEVGGVIEDFRKLPFLGLMVPFGRFFNNTVDFTAKNMIGVNTVAKLAGKYPDKTHGELVTQGLVAGGLIYTLAANEQEKRKQGLGMYDTIDPATGGVVSQQYDYPISLFIAAARFFSYSMEGEKAPPELFSRIAKDFGGGGLTRNLTDAGGLATDAVSALFLGELEKSGASGRELVDTIGSQLIGGFTRSWEPVDSVIGLIAGTEMRPQNIKDGNRFVGKALTYIDNTAQLFMGEPFNDPKVDAVQGERDVQLTKNLGVRTVRLTNSLRVMNMLSLNSWDNNASFKASKMAAGAANEYNRMFFQEMELVATRMMESPAFRELPLDTQRAEWKERVTEIREVSRSRLAYEYTGEQSTFGVQLEITDKYSLDDIRENMSELGYEGDLGDLNDGQIELLKGQLDSQKSIEEYTRETVSY